MLDTNALRQASNLKKSRLMPASPLKAPNASLCQQLLAFAIEHQEPVGSVSFFFCHMDWIQPAIKKRKVMGRGMGGGERSARRWQEARDQSRDRSCVVSSHLV